MFEIIGTEIEEGTRLIKVKDLAADLLMIYYQDEIPYIPDLELKFLLISRMFKIREGAYDLGAGDI